MLDQLLVVAKDVKLLLSVLDTCKYSPTIHFVSPAKESLEEKRPTEFQLLCSAIQKHKNIT